MEGRRTEVCFDILDFERVNLKTNGLARVVGSNKNKWSFGVPVSEGQEDFGVTWKVAHHKTLY